MAAQQKIESREDTKKHDLQPVCVCMCICADFFLSSFILIKVPRQVKMEPQHSEYFHVAGSKDAYSKVVPGMSATFTVSFTPQENKVGSWRQRGV